jgi:hypothetical protein
VSKEAIHSCFIIHDKMMCTFIYAALVQTMVPLHWHTSQVL